MQLACPCSAIFATAGSRIHSLSMLHRRTCRCGAHAASDDTRASGEQSDSELQVYNQDYDIRLESHNREID